VGGYYRIGEGGLCTTKRRKMKSTYHLKLKKGRGKFRPSARIEKVNGFRQPKTHTLERLMKPGMRIEP
jgi:hypothetical protein